MYEYNSIDALPSVANSVLLTTISFNLFIYNSIFHIRAWPALTAGQAGPEAGQAGPKAGQVGPKVGPQKH